MITVLGYEIQEKMRKNHNIDTYHAVRLNDKRQVLLKIPNNNDSTSDNLAILQHEFYLLKTFENPAIIKAYDFLQNTPGPVLILEDVRGQSLGAYLAVNQLEMGDFFNLALQLVDIVGELHQGDIIHKEIKPSNIIIDVEKMELKLVDLSASTKLLEEPFHHPSLGMFGEDLGYISPEQTGRINRPIDYRTDFYSLGVTLYEMLTGQLPFQCIDNQELIYCHIAKRAPSVLTARRNIPKMLASIIEKLLEKMPEDRYASIVGIKSDIQECYKQWIVKRNVSEYSLGANDIQDRLSFSRNLYGREQQVHQLIQAFKRVGQSAKEIVFVSGYSGIGKTSLVKEVYKPIVEHRGYFIQGKFDQLQRGIPYSAIVNAFGALVKQLIAEGAERLDEIRTYLTHTLGNIGQVLIDVIPEVELIIGKQPAVPLLSPTEAQTRFNLVFQNFVRVFATANHPLVVFLDDLQWADNSSLSFIENLMQDRETKYMLIIGAYRDNEINENHPLQLSMNHLAKHHIKMSHLVLEPLELSSIQQLLQDALYGSLEKIQSLAQCVFDKTQGNPFFINEFLKLIYQDNLLTYSYEHGTWEWDLLKIQQQSSTDNVISLLRSKIQLLSQSTQETLKLASCIGHQFDFKTLLIINGQTSSQTAEQLWQAINSHLIIPLEETYKTIGLVGLDEQITDLSGSNLNYKFAHDRIQQATYELIEEKDRANIHLKIGRLLIKEKPLEEHEERLFVVLKHFNRSISMIEDIDERHLLAKYNYWASQKARSAAAYYAADDHLLAGAEFLEPNNWKKNYNLSFLIYKELAVCKYLIGDFTAADQYFSILLEYSRSALDNLEIYRLKIEMLSTLGRHEESIEIGLKALRSFAIKIPKKPNTLHILAAIYKIKYQLGKTSIENINLSPMIDLQQKAIVDLITQLLNSAFITNQQLFVLLTCKNISLSLKYGYTESTSMSIPVYAFVIMHSLNLYDDALSFIALYNRLKNEYGASNFEGKNQFVIGSFIEPYQQELALSNNTVNKAFRLCCDAGDLVYSNYSKLILVMHSLSAGKTLNEAKKNIQSSLSFMTRVKISDFINIVKFWEYSVQCLENPEQAKIEKSVIFEELIKESKSKTELGFFYSSLTRLHFLLGNYDEAITSGENHYRFAEYDTGLIGHIDGKFFFAMAMFNRFAQAPKAKQKAYTKKLKHINTFIKKYAGWCPVNFEAYSLLLDAEFARLQKEQEPALALYEHAIEYALAHGLVLVSAIASERAGNHCLEINLDRVARFYLHNADRYFKDWGAITKVRLLDQSNSKLNLNYNSSSNNDSAEPVVQAQTTPKQVDMLAILKLSQRIANEIRLDILLQKLLSIIIEITGAERGVIFSKTNDRWFVEAEGNLEHQAIHLKGLLVLDSPTKYPVSIFNHVQKTQEPIALSNAAQSALAAEDVYIKEQTPAALLMMPLFSHGQLCRILYLENNTSNYSFTGAHLNGLQMLASQAMTSLENAKTFYDTTHDALTGLANRNMLYEIFKLTTKQVSRVQGEVALLYLDVDSFREINDTLGREVGDKVLIHLADTVVRTLRDSDYAARVGGDEFTIMLVNTSTSTQLSVIMDRLFNALAKPVQIKEHLIQVSINIGISIYPQEGTDIQVLLQQADNACRQSKEKGKNQFHYFAKQDNDSNPLPE